MPARKSTTKASLWLLLSALSGLAHGGPADVPEDRDVPATARDEVEALAEELEADISLKEESEQEISIDADGSLQVPSELDGRKGWSVTSDIRALGAWSDLAARDGEDLEETEVLARARLGASRSLSPAWRLGARIAASCSSESCLPSDLFDDGTIGSTDNQLDVDEAFLHWYQSDRFDVALGRMQTRFITKGGVFAKSLDRNDSNNTRVTWTDGAHGTLHFENGWESHLIVQYNPEDGPAQVLREPLNFEDDGSRAAAFLSFANEQPRWYFTQRGLDISYYPSALKKDGLTDDSRIEDYWGIVARVAGRIPKRSTGRRVRFSAEVGYAPETPTRAGLDLPGEGDADGIAAAFTVSLMDFFPRHSIGFNVGHTEAGWLLSPQYNKNERLLELRYVWVATKRLTFDARIRERKELEELTSAVRKRRELDVFLRLTWRFQTQWPVLVR